MNFNFLRRILTLMIFISGTAWSGPVSSSEIQFYNRNYGVINNQNPPSLTTCAGLDAGVSADAQSFLGSDVYCCNSTDTLACLEYHGNTILTMDRTLDGVAQKVSSLVAAANTACANNVLEGNPGGTPVSPEPQNVKEASDNLSEYLKRYDTLSKYISGNFQRLQTYISTKSCL